MIKTIRLKDTIIAIVIPHTFAEPGISFFTPSDFSQQLAFMKHPAGKRIEPHTHVQAKREVLNTKEVLMIRSGRLRVDLYTENHEYITSETLQAGDVVLLASGGHGFEVLEDVEMFEVKQGPYTGENDKVRFMPSHRPPDHA
jgi:mannose-6-phosphate isomerase-like protein (cupin superfamily)